MGERSDPSRASSRRHLRGPRSARERERRPLHPISAMHLPPFPRWLAPLPSESPHRMDRTLDRVFRRLRGERARWLHPHKGTRHSTRRQARRNNQADSKAPEERHLPAPLKGNIEPVLFAWRAAPNRVFRGPAFERRSLRSMRGSKQFRLSPGRPFRRQEGGSVPSLCTIARSARLPRVEWSRLATLSPAGAKAEH